MDALQSHEIYVANRHNYPKLVKVDKIKEKPIKINK